MKWLKDFLRFGLCGNYWIWFHILVAGLMARIGLLVFTPAQSFVIVALIAIIWEFIEFFVECKGEWQTVLIIYGSKRRWFCDSLGDVLGAIACAALVVF